MLPHPFGPSSCSRTPREGSSSQDTSCTHHQTVASASRNTALFNFALSFQPDSTCHCILCMSCRLSYFEAFHCFQVPCGRRRQRLVLAPAPDGSHLVLPQRPTCIWQHQGVWHLRPRPTKAKAGSGTGFLHHVYLAEQNEHFKTIQNCNQGHSHGLM